MMATFPRVAVLVDLPRGEAAGGHVKYWERMARACASTGAPIDLTVYFSGTSAEEILSPRVRLRELPPVFSSARLKFLPYVPAHTDLATHHPKLAQELGSYNVIHSTDGFFAFAQTAERIAKQKNIPLTTSFHTDTPAYAEVFTHETLRSLLGTKLGDRVDRTLKFSAAQRLAKEARLKKHLNACAAALALRAEDMSLAKAHIPSGKVSRMRLGVDKTLFKPRPEARAEIERAYAIAPEKFLALFVGRVDAGKNMPLLLNACVEAIRRGATIHLAVTGLGPLSGQIKAALGDNATLAGQVPAEKLAHFYAAADCLCMASDIEIGGLVGVEALSCSCPVLASKASGVASLYGRSPAVEEIDSLVPSWTQALTALAQDKPRQATMREAAARFATQSVASWDDVLQEDFLPVWQNALRAS